VTGCVSPVEPVLGSAQGFAPGAIAESEIPLAVADGSIPVPSPAAAEAPIGASAVDSVTTAAVQTPEKALEPLQSASWEIAVPVPAPRDLASLTQSGTALSFATEEEATGTQADIAMASARERTASVSDTANSSQLQPKPVAKKKTLFAMLQARKEARDATVGNAAGSMQLAALPDSRTADLTGAAPDGSATLEMLPGHEDADDEGEGGAFEIASAGSLARLSPMGILRQTEKVEVGCFDPELVRLLKGIEAHYGRPVLVTSGYRSSRANRQAGGASYSMHIECKAADIQVAGVNKWDLAKYLRTIDGRGGVGTYCRTNSVHIDVGPERNWHHPCRRAKKPKRV
jgi:uncharacterized protein YcbK (DUF882 family)